MMHEALERMSSVKTFSNRCLTRPVILFLQFRQALLSENYNKTPICSTHGALLFSLKLRIIICCTYTEQPGGLRSCVAAPGQDAKPGSPAFSHSCCAGGAGSRSWTQIRPLCCGSGTGLAGRCPRRGEETGGPRLDRKRPRGTTGPPPGPQAPGRRWVELIEKEAKQ